ncbi:MAG: hypothetical protein R2754_02070 [Microthrixaceae bacterium]
MSIRDRFYTRKVAYAMTGPSGILSAGGGAAIGVLVGLGPVGVVVGAVAGWLLRVGAAVGLPRPAGGTAERIDPYSLRDRWNRLVRDAQHAESNYVKALHGTPQGPLRDRLEEVRGHITESVTEVWEIAKAGDAVEGARGHINRTAVEAELAETRAMRSQGDTPSLEATEQALLMQLATADRMDTTLRDSEARLRLLNARLDEAVTRAIELSVSQADATAAGTLRADVAGIVDEMEALRQAMVEVRASDVTTPPAIPDLNQGVAPATSQQVPPPAATQPLPQPQPGQTQPAQTHPPQPGGTQ